MSRRSKQTQINKHVSMCGNFESVNNRQVPLTWTSSRKFDKKLFAYDTDGCHGFRPTWILNARLRLALSGVEKLTLEWNLYIHWTDRIWQ